MIVSWTMVLMKINGCSHLGTTISPHCTLCAAHIPQKSVMWDPPGPLDTINFIFYQIILQACKNPQYIINF